MPSSTQVKEINERLTESYTKAGILQTQQVLSLFALLVQKYKEIHERLTESFTKAGILQAQ